MIDFLENPLFLLALTFLIYYGAVLLQKRFNSALLNPVLITAILLIIYLLCLGITPAKYEEAGKYIDFWLKPSIVALGVPLLVSQLVGSVVGIVSVCLLAKAFGLDNELTRSLVPKSVTTPIALEVSRMVQGAQPLTVMAVMITGFFGNIFGLMLLRWFQVKSPMGKGIALGTASHALGIMAAFNLSEKYAVYASLGMIFNGIFTAILAPVVVGLLF